jgi:hypothetical protein
MSLHVKSLTISPEIARERNLAELMETANSALIDVLGTSAPLVDVEWTAATDDRGLRLLVLSMSDGTETRSAAFAPDEFQDDPRLRRRLYSLWGDLLQVRLDQEFRELRQAVKVLGE